MSSAQISVARGTTLLALIVGIAYAIWFADLNEGMGETGAAATNLLLHGMLGNPYRISTGPSAHVSPAVGAILAVIYWLFGSGTHEARIALGILAAALYAGSIWAVFAVCKATKLSGVGFYVAAAALVSCPVFLFQSVVNFRQWDQPFAAFLLPLGWLAYERGRLTGELRYLVGLAGLAGIGSLFSPTLLTAFLLALGLLVWHRRALAPTWRTAVQGTLGSGLLAVAIVAAFTVPWGMRNEAQLGRFVLTRSNFGLELWLGNMPGALGWSETGEGFARHPHDDVAAATEMARTGEIAFMDARKTEVLAIIKSDPARFVSLTVKRIWLCFFPVPEMVGWHPGFGSFLPWLLLTLFGAAKLTSLALVLATSRRAFACLLFSAAPLLPYAITHVNLRYEFNTYFTSVLVIAFAAETIRGRRVARPTRDKMFGSLALNLKSSA